MQWHERIGLRLRLRDLHVLSTVIRRGSMAKAALDLAVTQPAVSKAIADLEHVMGVKLLERQATGVEPTQYGSVLLRYGDGIFEDLRRAVQEIEWMTDPAVGEVSVGATNPIVDGLLPAAVARLSTRYPRIVVSVTQAALSAPHYDELRARKLDILVGRLPSAFNEDGLVAEELFREPMAVVAGARSKWSTRRRLELADLADELWVLPGPETAVGAFIRTLFTASGVPFPRQGVVCTAMQFSVELISTGRYVGLLPTSYLHFRRKRESRIRVLPVELPLQPPPVGVIAAKGRQLSPAATQFVDCLKAVAAPLQR